MCGLLEIGLRGVIFALFFCGRPERCTFPTAPWPAAAPTTSQAPPAAKTHHLPGTGSYLEGRDPGVKTDGAYNRRTGAGYVSHKDGDYARAQAEGVECVPLLVETFGGLSPALTSVLREAADWRSNKLTSSEYDETTWSARTWLTFVAQRISVAVQLSMAQEAAEALGLSVAADPRAR